MKLKKKAILYMEGMLDKEEEKEFKKEILLRPDIQEFIQNYQWIDAGLKMRYSQPENLKNESVSEEALNEQVKKDIEKYLKNFDSHGDTGEQDFIHRLKENREQNSKSSSKNYGSILNIAATIAFIVLIISGVIHFSDKKREVKIRRDLFTDNFHPSEDPLVHKINSPFVTVEEDRLILTEEGKIFHDGEVNSILRTNRMSYENLLMISILLIQESEFSTSEIYLTDIIENGSQELSDAARWYLSLAKIREGINPMAIENLKILCKGRDYYRSDACQLLKTLDEKNID